MLVRRAEHHQQHQRQIGKKERQNQQIAALRRQPDCRANQQGNQQHSQQYRALREDIHREIPGDAQIGHADGRRRIVVGADEQFGILRVAGDDVAVAQLVLSVHAVHIGAIPHFAHFRHHPLLERPLLRRRFADGELRVDFFAYGHACSFPTTCRRTASTVSATPCRVISSYVVSCLV